MKIDDVIALLENRDDVEESYVLVRELKIYLNVGAGVFPPKLGIKIWKSWVLTQNPYHFTVSHHVHTPTQAGPYYPSRTEAATEAEAIDKALSTTLTFLRHAISEGCEPSESWLVPNDDF